MGLGTVQHPCGEGVGLGGGVTSVTALFEQRYLDDTYNTAHILVHSRLNFFPVHRILAKCPFQCAAPSALRHPPRRNTKIFFMETDNTLNVRQEKYPGDFIYRTVYT